ncbi:MAG: pirin family protein [Acidimicrobiales bacterium]
MGAHEVEISTSRVAEVGGLELRRSLPQPARRTIGAWCFADHYGPVAMTDERSMSIGPHPHIGLHTVTWLFAGEMLHTDSLGSEQLIRPGQLNLMTAGRGIAHAEETPASHRGLTHGMQLWVAQPESTRHGDPAFEHHPELPEVAFGPAVARVLVGSLGEAPSPARTDTPLIGVDVALSPGRATIPVDPAHEHGVIVARGEVRVDGRPVPTDSMAYLPLGRHEVTLGADAPARLLLLGGAPLGETIHMWWNFVARSHAEIDQAAAEWNAGSDRFGEPVSSHLPRIPSPTTPWST